MKLLITSVGSRVSKHILDVLEFPGVSRRSLVRIVGTNSMADSPTNFRCDRCYLVPETAAAGYAGRMREILLEERPDLILCGRDADTLALSRLREQHPGLPGVLPVGTPQSALIGLDKWQTWQFSRRHSLPCAETFLARASGDAAALQAFCSKTGYPLVAKPAQGFASRGVYFLRDARDVQAFAGREGYLLQEYLGDPGTLEPYFESLAGPPPLSAGAPDAGYYACQTVIAPSGDPAPPFVTFHPHEQGAPSQMITRVMDPSLDALSLAYGLALAEEGVRGPVNASFRRDRLGNWKLQELNLRNTGSTLARFLLGMDELYLIARDFVPDAAFPEMRLAESDRPGRVGRHDATYLVSERAAATLTSAGTWSSGEISGGTA